MTEGITTRAISNPDGTLHAYDRRQIGYGEFGDPDGKPIVLCHGFGDSRLTRHPDDELTARLGVRLITVDRPGIGMTDPMKELTLIDRVRDIEEVANALKLDQFAVLGWSGGAPFALAAAHELGDRVTRVGIAAGFGPFDRSGFRQLAPKEIRRVILILKVAPWMSGMLAKESAKQLQGDTHTMSNGDGLASSSDAALLARGQVRQNISRGAEEAFRQGHEGVAADMLLVFRFKWGFKPEDVERPVELWYGDEDRMTPVEVGRGLASLLPDARLRVSPGAGHLLHIKYWEEILQTLTGERTAEVRAAAPWVQPLVAEPVATEVAAEEPAAPEPAAAEPVAAQPTPADAALETMAADSMAATVALPAGEDTGRDATQPEVAEADAGITEAAPQTEAPAATVETAAPVPQAPALAADERERLRAAGFLIEEEESEAAVPPPEDVTEVAEAPAVEETVEEAAYVDEVVSEPALVAPADEIAAVALTAAVDEEAAEAVQPETASLDADEEERLRAAGFAVEDEEPEAASPVLEEVAEELEGATAVDAVTESVSAAPPDESVAAEPVAGEAAQMVEAAVVAVSDLPIDEATAETELPVEAAEAEVRVEAAATSSDDASTEPSADAVAEATAGVHEEMIEAAVVAESELLIETTAETEVPVEAAEREVPVEAAATSSDDAHTEPSADATAEATGGIHEETVEAAVVAETEVSIEAAVVAESELPIETTVETEGPVEAAVASSDEAETEPSADAAEVDTAAPEADVESPAAEATSDVPRPEANTDVAMPEAKTDFPGPEATTVDAPVADGGMPETEPAASDEYEVLRDAGFFVEEPEEERPPVAVEKPEGGEEAEQLSDEVTSRSDVQEPSEAPAETKDVRGEGIGAEDDDSAVVEAEASAAEADATPQGSAETVDLMRADELTQRLDELADRYALAVDVSDSEDDGGDEPNDAAGSAAVAPHEDVQGVVDVFGEAPSALAAGTGGEPDRAVDERGFDDVTLVGAAGEPAPDVDPMLERLRAAGFTVTDAVQPGGR